MRKKNIAGIVFLLIAGGAAAWRFHPSNGKKDDSITRAAQAQPGVMEEAVEATGEVAPLNRVEIKPPIAGRIEKILVEEGARVRSGQILAWMSSSDRAAILDAARAQGPDALARWEDTYKPTPIVAPLTGVIILRNVVVGQTVDMGSVLFALSDRLIVLAHVDEVDIGVIRTGLPARITLDSFPDEPIPGHVFNILYEGKNVSNVITYGVKVEPDRVPPFFRSQMTANVRFVTRRKEDALLVPAAAVLSRKRGQREVWVPGPDGKPLAREVTVGLENSEQAEILSGLRPGDTVLIVQRRYQPQRAAASSPLVMGGRSRSPGTQAGGGRDGGQSPGESNRSRDGSSRGGGGER